MSHRYAPHETHMSNVVKTSGCRPLFQRRVTWWGWFLRPLLYTILFLVFFALFFGAMFIIAEVVVR